MAIEPKDLTKFYPGAAGFGRRISERIKGRGGVGDDEGDDEDTDKGGGRETTIWTLFTKPGSTRLITAPTSWSRVHVILTTAGPVAVGTSPALHPATSGHGILLPQDTPVTFSVPKGTRVYYAADAANRLSVIVEPIPWLEQIAAGVSRAAKLLSSR